MPFTYTPVTIEIDPDYAPYIAEVLFNAARDEADNHYERNAHHLKLVAEQLLKATAEDQDGSIR